MLLAVKNYANPFVYYFLAQNAVIVAKIAVIQKPWGHTPKLHRLGVDSLLNL
jgi:hypothetical protein